jgi:ATP-binding cassette subfamily C (CFTR/MRP) protein 1
MKGSTVFSKLMDEYGSLESERSRDGRVGQQNKGRATADDPDEIERKKFEAALMQAEERNTGAVTWDVYKKYLGFAGGVVWAPVILLLLTLYEAASGVHEIMRDVV